MVNYISMYDAFVEQVYSSEEYKNSIEREKEDINRFLESREVRKYFEGKVVAQLDLHESLTLAFANSEALHNRTPEEQSKVMRHLNSLSFKKVIGNIERRLMV